MYEVIKTMYVEACHYLKGHPGRCANLHGHGYRIRVHLTAHKLTDGMVIDFSDMKVIMDDCIDRYDHALIVDSTSEDAEELEHRGGLKLAYTQGRPTAEKMARTIYYDIRDRVPVGVWVVKVCVRETENNEACYYEKQ